MTTLGLIGAGHIGSQVARLAVANGYDVVISNSRGPETLAALVAELGPRARAATALEAAKAGEIVVVTIPLKAIDTNNYYAGRDGHIRDLDEEKTTSSELLQAHLPSSKVVKAFNHIHAAQITTDGLPAGAPNRRALVIAGNDADAKAVVTRMLDRFGFDTVDAGPLSASWRIQPNTPGYGPRRNAEELRGDLAAARELTARRLGCRRCDVDHPVAAKREHGPAHSLRLTHAVAMVARRRPSVRGRLRGWVTWRSARSRCLARRCGRRPWRGGCRRGLHR
jgi:predicted dinucleotide-binding enzyme